MTLSRIFFYFSVEKVYTSSDVVCYQTWKCYSKLTDRAYYFMQIITISIGSLIKTMLISIIIMKIIIITIIVIIFGINELIIII